MTAFLTLVGVLALVVCILGSVALHEVGHMLPAKRFGVRVPEYMVGFGPRLWSTVRGETEYGVKAIPLGGYVKLIGMYPPEPARPAAAGDAPDGDAPDGDAPGGAEKAPRPGRIAELVESAREASAAEILPGDEHRVFYKLTVPKKVVVMLGGPTMNLLLATGLFALLLVGFGLPTATNSISRVVACTPTSTGATATPTASGACPSGTTASAAAQAGIKPGDTITAVGPRQVSGWSELSAAILATGSGPTTITYERDGQSTTVDVVLPTVTRPKTDADGNQIAGTEQRPFLGVAPQGALVRQPVTAVPGYMWNLTTMSVGALVTMPVRLYDLTTGLFTNAPRSQEDPVSVVGVTRIGGEVAGSTAPTQEKVAQLIALVASLNLFLFLFNLVPLLPLDGGHVAGALWEGLRRRLAAWRGKPDPGPVDVARALPVAYVVSMALIAMGVVVIYADIVKPISLGG
jgi:membrane-associated protease RseP (regulator of RpoE activity)